MYLSTTLASKVYFNLQMPEVEEFNSCLSDGPIKVLEIPKKGVDASVVIAKKKTIREILIEANSNFEQNLTFYYLATIKGFSNKNGWNFHACARHKTSAKAAGTKFWCQKCMLIIDDPVIRYRLEAEVEDETGSTKFIIFDDEAQEILGMIAQQLHDMEEANDEVKGSFCIYVIKKIIRGK
ncbi:replication protein A 70 kDa DNA-binding subunit D-like isoform X1 [Silene latifolia]|uniref:replication protein A 70 kDa DNA-binding subunit D-like isoform X1 n=1 Tax=Silene latifolia TaxID=37657 RepID=UPI003D78AE50